MPDLLLELFSEEIPARMQRQAAEDLKRLVTNALVERNLTLRGRAELRHPPAPDPSCGRPAVRSAQSARGAQGPPRRRSGRRHPGLPEERRPRAHRGREDRDRPEEGRILCRRDREAGPRNQGRDRGDHPCDRPLVSVAEIDALGRRRRRSPTRCAGSGRCAASSARLQSRTTPPRSSGSKSTGSQLAM